MHQLARHSLSILEIVKQYDSFLESLKHIADMGCGTGEDTAWWATLENNDDPPIPYNFNCFAVDRDASKLAQIPDLPNIHKTHRDFTEERIFPVQIDLMWAHDSLQYSHNPLQTLRNWNAQMNVNAMLLLTIPQHAGVAENRYYSRTYNGCYFNYTPSSLIYMLAVNGFDCRDAYLLKRFQDPWIQMAVYKTAIAPMDPATTTWYELADKNLLHPSVVASINSNGYLKQEEIVMPWLDKENYFIDYVSQHELPFDVPLANVEGVFNETTRSTESTITQAKPATKETKLLKPIKSIKPPKRNFTK